MDLFELLQNGDIVFGNRSTGAIILRCDDVWPTGEIHHWSWWNDRELYKVYTFESVPPFGRFLFTLKGQFGSFNAARQAASQPPKATQ